MNRMQLLKEYYEQEQYNLLCYSKDYSTNIPKDNFIREWKNEKEKIKILQQMIIEEKTKTQKNTNIEKLTQNLIKFYKEYDPYDFIDNETEYIFEETLKAVIVNPKGVYEYLQSVIEDDRGMVEEAKKLKKELEKVFPALESRETEETEELEDF